MTDHPATVSAASEVAVPAGKGLGIVGRAPREDLAATSEAHSLEPLRNQVIRDSQDERWRRYITAILDTYTPRGAAIVLAADVELSTEMTVERVAWAESLARNIGT